MSQARAGEVSGALDTASHIEDGYYKVATMSFIADVQAKSGDKSGARKTIDEARMITAGIERPSHKIISLGSIAEAQANTGDIDQALNTAAYIQETRQDANNNSDLLQKIVEAQLRAKDIEGALKTTSTIIEASNKASALSKIAIAQAESGDQAGAEASIREAFRTAEKVHIESFKAWVLRDIAAAQIGVGDRSGAGETMARIHQMADGLEKEVAGGSPDPDSLLSDKANIYSIAGDMEKSLQIAATITNVFHKQWTLARIADSQVKMGDLKGAKETASAMSNGVEKIRILMDIALEVHNRLQK